MLYEFDFERRVRMCDDFMAKYFDMYEHGDIPFAEWTKEEQKSVVRDIKSAAHFIPDDGAALIIDGERGGLIIDGKRVCDKPLKEALRDFGKKTNDFVSGALSLGRTGSASPIRELRLYRLAPGRDRMDVFIMWGGINTLTHRMRDGVFTEKNRVAAMLLVSDKYLIMADARPYTLRMCFWLSEKTDERG